MQAKTANRGWYNIWGKLKPRATMPLGPKRRRKKLKDQYLQSIHLIDRVNIALRQRTAMERKSG